MKSRLEMIDGTGEILAGAETEDIAQMFSDCIPYMVEHCRTRPEVRDRYLRCFADVMPERRKMVIDHLRAAKLDDLDGMIVKLERHWKADDDRCVPISEIVRETARDFYEHARAGDVVGFVVLAQMQDKLYWTRDVGDIDLPMMYFEIDRLKLRMLDAVNDAEAEADEDDDEDDA